MSLGIPGTLDELLSPGWLTEALGIQYPGIRVERVTPGPVISRVATNARIRIECAGGLPDGLPAQLCVKGYVTQIGWPARYASVPEVFFYKQLAASLPMRTLGHYFAEVDEATGHGVLITEDVVVQGATFLDALAPYTADQVAQSLEELALLHSATWGSPQCATAPWLQSRLPMYLSGRGLPQIEANFGSAIGAGVPAAVRNAGRLIDAYRALGDLVESASPWSVIHGDSHIGNVYLDRRGRPSFVDWQLVQRGPWYLDVGYHLASALTVTDRREQEEALVRHYLDRLAAGVPDVPSWDDAMIGVRRGMLHGFYLWGITAQVDPAITTVLLERLGTAVDDHDAYASVVP